MMDTTFPIGMHLDGYWQEKQKQLCPFIVKHHDSCYCTVLNSQTIEAALYFCGENFTNCKFYPDMLDKGTGNIR